ncbi:MAG: transglycosylase SLT domain-containing protein [Deltaproteobacteria bacterium]|nr:transglycosylase SLT domain-containing protein [Deltaproteobacteria bacterium]
MKTIDENALESVSGGVQMPASARWIMQHESGGNPHAQNPHSTAYGAFQMLKATRKEYMGANWRSGDLGQQYAGASRYVHARYGSWDNAKAFWQRHHWY